MSQGSSGGTSLPFGPAEGTDPSGAVTVTIDAAHRVTGVRLLEDRVIRTPDTLTRAIDDAYSAALTLQLEAARRDRPPRPPGQRPVPVATLPTFRRPTREQLTRHRVREESRHVPRAATGDATGVSTNDCVAVTLRPAQPTGPVVADAGWLANASLANAAAAITEAFQNAYTERDKP